MNWALRILQRLGEKALKVDPADVFTQQNADDIVSIIRELIL